MKRTAGTGGSTMPRAWRRVWLAAALGGSLLLGCERAAVRPPYPPDPMFLTRKPVPGNAEKAQPLLAHSEPAVPSPPETALASAPRQRLATVKASLVSRPAATPEAVRTSGNERTPGAAEESAVSEPVESRP